MDHSESHFSHAIIAKQKIALAGKLYIKHGGLETIHRYTAIMPSMLLKQVTQ